MTRVVIGLTLAACLVSVTVLAGGECSEIGGVVEFVGGWVDFFRGDDPYTFAQWWYGGPLCLDGGAIY